MEEKDKFIKLLHHYREHNEEHTNLYQNLAHKASTFGNTQLIEILERLFIESDKLNSLFEEALTILEKNENE
jgi:hypothetical protein